MRRTYARWFAIFLAGGSLLAGEPEEAPDEVLETGIEETVEVTAPRPKGEDVAAFATTILADDAAGRGRDLADLLRSVPGARVRSYGGLGSQANLSLRASTFEQVTVLVDGVRQNRALGGPVDLSSIPVTQIDRVTVFRGFGPAGFGLGGIGGVVDVRTRIPEEISGHVDALAGELNTQRLSAGVALGRSEISALSVGFERLRSDGDFTFLDSNGTLHTQDDDAEVRRRNNDREQNHLWVRGMREDVGGGRLSGSLRLQRRDRGVPTVENGASETARSRDDLYDLTASWFRGGGARLDDVDLQLNLFRQDLDFDDAMGDLGSPSMRETRLRGLALAAVMRKRAGRHGLLFRLDAGRETARVRDDLDARLDGNEDTRDSVALTVEDVISFGRLTLAPSARLDRRRDDFGDGDERSTEGSLSGKLGAALRLGPATSLRGSVGRFHREPNLLELFGDRGSVVGDVDLRPERGTSIELGLAASDPRGRTAWSFEAVGFARRSEDLIWFIQKSDGVAKAVNIARAEVRGLELASRLRLARGLTFDAGVTLQDATDRSGGFPDGFPLPYNPERLGHLGLTFERRGFRCGWEATHVGRNSTDQLDTPARRIPSREIHDVDLSYAWADGIRLGLDVRNLFDTRTLDLSRYPLPRRVVLLHLGWRSNGRTG